MLSAISFGVFWRDALSTSEIIRSRKVSPGFCVISITMRSLSTRVPPVTALRSPPASRMTGADSPVIADSSTLAMPSMMVPSLGMTSPASQTTTSPLRRSMRGNRVSLPPTPPCNLRAIGLGARAAQRLRLRLAAAFGDGLGEVGEEHGEPQPERDLADEAAVGAAARRAAMNAYVVITAPISTTNITGLRAMVRGSSFDEALADRREAAAPGR